jgi:hypothetical protein
MPTESCGGIVQFEVELQFQGVGQEQPPDTSVFVYDANGLTPSRTGRPVPDSVQGLAAGGARICR